MNEKDYLRYYALHTPCWGNADFDSDETDSWESLRQRINEEDSLEMNTKATNARFLFEEKSSRVLPQMQPMLVCSRFPVPETDRKCQILPPSKDVSDREITELPTLPFKIPKGSYLVVKDDRKHHLIRDSSDEILFDMSYMDLVSIAWQECMSVFDDTNQCDFDAHLKSWCKLEREDVAKKMVQLFKQRNLCFVSTKSTSSVD